MTLDRWIIHDPEEGWQEADSRADFDAVLDHYRDQGGDGWREDVESLALYRLVPVTTVRLVQIASVDDATEDGARCRAAGWDYLSKLVEDQHEDPAERAAAVERERDAALAHVKRLQGWTVHSALCALQVAGEPPCNCGLSAARASTPAASLEEHDRRVRAAALREAAEAVAALNLAGTLGEVGAYQRAAGVLHLRADAVERGEP